MNKETISQALFDSAIELRRMGEKEGIELLTPSQILTIVSDALAMAGQLIKDANHN